MPHWSGSLHKMFLGEANHIIIHHVSAPIVEFIIGP